ncbi:lysylphosphatidylglycerol synthase transmembrane domain-containing protein [Pedobacter aquatilis]|uniref:lysylphosphatidylglycerol synthase transmembrane domain-containing protein n=1 Tax=Pedobacter aquatilis TaxID=351343 RepID=UPI0025B3EECF|nr:lysylphosphatidylglycerol synthase transmembrane domain-containing protein [Pedobacter aquatilis]MDN3587707.1 lysylphosphatidylglycerol synthase transmembrane domain-containing protein [Pedobacter aquatilis]
MNFSFKLATKYLILLAIGFGILYLAFKDQDLEKIWAEIIQANLYWVCLSASCVLIANVLRALRWRMLYKSINYNIGFEATFHALIIGYLANLALPRFGEIGRCSVLLRTEKIPLSSSIGTVVTERLIDVAILFFMGLLILIFQYHLIFDFLYQTIYLNLINKFQNINYYVLIVIVLVLIIGGFFIIRLLKSKINKKFLRIFVGLKQGFNSVTQVKSKTLFTIYTIGIWVFYFLSMYTCFFSIHSTQNLGFSAAFTALVFSSFAMVAPVQGGIGIFHWMVAKALVLYSIPFYEGLTYATIIHSAQVLITLILGTVSLIIVLTKRNDNVNISK